MVACSAPKLTLQSITPRTERIAFSTLLAQAAQLIPRSLSVRVSILGIGDWVIGNGEWGMGQARGVGGWGRNLPPSLPTLPTLPHLSLSPQSPVYATG